MPLSNACPTNHQNRKLFPGDAFDLLPKDQLVVIGKSAAAPFRSARGVSPMNIRSTRYRIRKDSDAALEKGELP